MREFVVNSDTQIPVYALNHRKYITFKADEKETDLHNWSAMYTGLYALFFCHWQSEKKGNNMENESPVCQKMYFTDFFFSFVKQHI